MQRMLRRLLWALDLAGGTASAEPPAVKSAAVTAGTQ
jgi:hypothetical protein